jgi:hypothetical protein
VTLYAKWADFEEIHLPMLNRVGYTFNGWRDGTGNLYNTGTYSPTGNITLTA